MEVVRSDKNKELKLIGEEIDAIFQESVIQEVLTKIGYLKKEYERYSRDYCPHLMWIVPKTYWEYAPYQDIKCIVCNSNKIIKHADAHKLYNQKRLIGIMNEFNSRYIPIEGMSLDDVRSYYLSLLQERLELKTEEPIEDIIWEHFCNETREKSRSYQKKFKQKKTRRY